MKKILVFLIFVFILTSILVVNEKRFEEKAGQLETLKKSQEEIRLDLEILKLKEQQKEVNYIRGKATAYHPPSGGINSDENPEITSIGKPAEVGVIAVDPETIPYYSEVMIIKDNTVIRGQALDTGAAMRRNKNHVDILMDCKEKADEWGTPEAHIIWW